MGLTAQTPARERPQPKQEQFVKQLRTRRVKPHVAEYAPNPKWPNWPTEEERSGEEFLISQKRRKLVERCLDGQSRTGPHGK